MTSNTTGMDWRFLVYEAAVSRQQAMGPGLVPIADIVDIIKPNDGSITARRVSKVLCELGLTLRGKIRAKRAVFLTAESLAAAEMRLKENREEVKQRV